MPIPLRRKRSITSVMHCSGKENLKKLPNSIRVSPPKNVPMMTRKRRRPTGTTSVIHSICRRSMPKALRPIKTPCDVIPMDHEARYNLRMAQLKTASAANNSNRIRITSSNNRTNSSNKNQQNQNKNQDRDDKNQQQNSPQQQPNQNPQNPERQDDRPADNGQPQPGSISPENAQQILDAMQQDEKKTQEKVQQKLLDQRQRRKTDKEW